VDDLWATKSEDVELIVRAITFQDFQSVVMITNVTDRWTDDIIIDFPNTGITYNGGWCSATIPR